MAPPSLNDLINLMHYIVEFVGKNLNLKQLPTWDRNSPPRTPIFQKFGIIVLCTFYPYWASNYDFHLEPLGHHSPDITKALSELEERGIIKFTRKYDWEAEFKIIRQLWGKAFWSPSYFLATTG